MLFLVFNRKYSWIYTLHSIHNIKVLTFPLSSFGVLLLLLFHSLMMLLLLTLSTFNWKARMDLNFFNYVKYKKKTRVSYQVGYFYQERNTTKLLLKQTWMPNTCLQEEWNTNNWTNAFTVTSMAFRHTVLITESHLFNGKLC